MGSVTPKGKGKNKTYVARAWWTNTRGDRKSKQASGFTTQKTAWDWVKETEEANTKTAYPDAHKLTVDGLYDHWIAHLKKMKRSPKTLESYEDNYEKKMRSYIGHILVQELHTLHLQEMFDELKSKPINIPVRKSKLPPEQRQRSQKKPDDQKQKRLPRSATIHSIYRTLKAMLNYAIKKLGVIQVNPCIGVDLPYPQKHITHIYTGEDLVKLMQMLKELEHPLYYPIMLTVPYALRRGEALGITWSAIDLDKKQIMINRNWTISRGKSILKGVKNERAEEKEEDCVIAINDWTCDELRKLKKERLEMKMLTHGETPDPDLSPDGCVYENDIVVSDFVWWDENKKLFRPDGMVGRLNTFQRTNGLPRCTWHDLRHTYGNLMAEDGQDVVAISKAMRHSSVKITSDQYIDATLTLKQRATAAFDNVIKMPVKEAQKEQKKS